MSRIARLKYLAMKSVEEQLPGFRFEDTEEHVSAKKAPMFTISSDAGTEFETSRYGTIRGTTNLKVDVFLCVGRDINTENNADTDIIQDSIRKAILNNQDLKHEFQRVICTKTMAINIPGESGLRALFHDFEVSWLDV